MGSKKVKTTSNETATTTPNTFAGAMPAVNNYYGKVSGLMNLPAEGVAPGFNGLQQNAADRASSLGSSGGAYDYARTRLVNGVNQINAVQPSALATSATPTSLTATLAQAPAAYDTAAVQRTAMPTAAQAGVADLPGAYLAGDTSGLADKDVNTFGGTSASGFMSQYMNPLLSDYVDATTADYDEDAGRKQAAYARKGAQNKAFGDSRYAFGESQLVSDLARGRASTRAGLYSDAWNKALGAASGDADRGNAAGIASMQAQNDRDSLLAQLSQNYGLANAGALNNLNLAGFNAQNTANLSNAQSLNALLSQAFGIDANANSQDATAQNNMLSQLFAAQQANGQFNAGQQNQTAQFNAGQALNNNQFNASAANQNNQYNTGLAFDQGKASVDGANSLANILSQKSNAQTNELSTLNNIGNSQWGIQQQQNLAPYTQAGLLSDAINPQLLALLSGQTITSNGTSTSKQSGGLLASILGPAAQLGAAAIAKSERRVKRDVRLLGHEDDGLGVYAYNYIWDDDTELPRFGVMVDEVERIRPWALGPVVGGIQTVNYGAL